MPEITLTIHHQVGLHARPAALFVRTAKAFGSTIRVTHGERAANAKSILGVLALGATQGAVITVQATGDDAAAALAALADLVASDFAEETCSA